MILQKKLRIFISVCVISVVGLYLYNGSFSLPKTTKSKGKVIGDLGGVTVEIPRKYARFLEYNNEPHFMEKGPIKNIMPTYQSKIRNLGFSVLFPEMSAVPILRKEKKNIYTSMELRVGVNAGENYGVEGYLNRKKDYYLTPPFPCFSKCFNYHKLPEDTHGLTGYTPTGTGVDVEQRAINSGRGTDMRDRNIYFLKNNTGDLTTFIQCSNSLHAVAPCQQSFSLSPKMKARIKVSYRIGLLPHWQEIQQSISNLLYSFEVDGNKTTSSNLSNF